MSAPARRAAVLGSPIGHSLSPVLHRAAYEALGLSGWTYEAIEVDEAGLPALVADLDDSWAGLSLTMPLKQAVLPLLDHVEPLAEVLGVVNTVLVQAGAGRVLVGANTDVHGVVAALSEGLSAGAVPRPVRDAVVLGAGATAASVLAALAQLGCARATVLARSMARAGATMRAARRMGVEPRFLTMAPQDRLVELVTTADVVVSTLPAHAADGVAAALRAGEGPGPVSGVLLDCAYTPSPTALGASWGLRGGVVVGGERMLLHQAAEQVRLMTGLPGPLPAMEAALDTALSRVR